MTPSSTFARSRGFTLVEVLVALAIVALGMSAVLGALSSAADSTIYLRDKTLAEWIALNRITEQRLGAQRPGEGKSEGEIEYAGRRWRWEQEVREIEVPGVFRIDVRVRPADVESAGAQSWTTTVSGALGDAVAPSMFMTQWSGQEVGPGQPGGPGGADQGDGERQPGESTDESPPQNQLTQ